MARMRAKGKTDRAGKEDGRLPMSGKGKAPPSQDGGALENVGPDQVGPGAVIP
jgi:hypothetical protein